MLWRGRTLRQKLLLLGLGYALVKILRTRLMRKVMNIHYGKSATNERLLGYLKQNLLNKPYRAPWLLTLSWPHLLAAGARPKPKYRFSDINGDLAEDAPCRTVYDRELLVNSTDGGTIALDWLKPKAGSAYRGPTIALIPGVNGDSEAPYILHAAHEVVRQGWQAVVLNHRGTANAPITSEKLYSATATDDFKDVFQHLSEKCHNNDIFAVSYSLGSIRLTKYLGEMGENSLIKGAALFSHPCDLVRSTMKLPWLLDQVILHNLLKMTKIVEEKVPGHPILLDYAKRKAEYGSEIRSVIDYDDHLTCKMWGYESAVHYYMDGSIKKWLPKIKTPCMYVIATDDPMIEHASIPFEEAKVHPNVIMVTTETGSHVGWHEGNFLPTAKSWMDRAAVSYINAHLNTATHKS